MAPVLLGIESLLALVGFVYIFKRDNSFGIFYFFLFVYAIFPQIGYYYFSELSETIYAYFGKEPWYVSTYFIILSLTSILLFFALFWSRLIKLIPFTLVVSSRKSKNFSVIVIIFVLILLLFELDYLISNWSVLSYYQINNLGDEGSKSKPLLFIFLQTIKLLLVVNFALYSVIRQRRSVYSKQIVKLVFILGLITFFAASFRTGNRTDIVALSLGILIYELSNQTKFRWIKFAKSKLFFRALIFIPFLLYGLFFIRSARLEGQTTFNLLEIIFFQDYYNPAHMLFAASEYNYISPEEVFTSNLFNSFVMLDYPYLQLPVTELFLSGATTRSGSYAFYVLTEGYMVLGKYGFIYNALVIILLFAIWRRFSLSNDKLFNTFATGLMGCMIVNLVRSQTSFFFKYLYMMILPGIVVYLALTGLKISFKLKF
jgi:hypothetical protein